MFKALTPLIGIAIAIGLFFVYIRPTFQEIKSIQDETAEYAQATEKAAELQGRISEPKNKQTAIPLTNIERLEALVPNHIDEVAVLIDLNTLAVAHRLTLADIKVAQQSATTAGSQQTQEQGIPDVPVAASAGQDTVGKATTGDYHTLDMSFSVSGTYTDFRMFLQDIERSLVLMDVTKISFLRTEGGSTLSFKVGVRLYAINSPTP